MNSWAEARSVKKCLDGSYGGRVTRIFIKRMGAEVPFFLFLKKPRLKTYGGELGVSKGIRKAMMGVKIPLLRNEWDRGFLHFLFTYVLRSNHGGEAGSFKYYTGSSDGEMENLFFDELMGLGVSKCIRKALMGVKIPFCGMDGAGSPFLFHSHTLSARVMGERLGVSNTIREALMGR